MFHVTENHIVYIDSLCGIIKIDVVLNVQYETEKIIGKMSKVSLDMQK
jgi:hypothetical protein